MEETILIRSNNYADSVTLMSLSQKVQRLEGVAVAMVGMGTPLNLEVLEALKFGTRIDAGANDLIIAIRAESPEELEKALAKVDELMNKGGKNVSGENRASLSIKSYGQARESQDSNLVLISVPGIYAEREARKALAENLNVMLFSDNVSIEAEVRLKRSAHEKGLLLMGPDCGTAIINGVPLAFANQVRRGRIGVVGASGTGIQEVMVQIDRMGEGLSQVIGTGGRDLQEAVGGIMMLDGIEALKHDPETKVILVVSKPAAPGVAEKVFQALKECGKPTVLYLIGTEKTKGIRNVNVDGDKKDDEDKFKKVKEENININEDTNIDKAENKNKNIKVIDRNENRNQDINRNEKICKNVHFAGDLLEAAQIAVKLAGGSPVAKEVMDRTLVRQKVNVLQAGQKYVRGLFSGGTLCDEAMEVLTEKIGLIYSNGPLDPAGQLENPNLSIKNTILDLGDDYFTVGRPHPMIDLSLRIGRLEEEAADSEVAVILFDVVLGYGSHLDPASELAPAIRKAQGIAAQTQREIIFIAYVCGSLNDPQGYEEQTRKLRDVGVLVFRSNVEAAEFTAAVIIGQIEGGGK